MKSSILSTKSKAFALRIVRRYKYLRDRRESVIAKVAACIHRFAGKR